MGSKTHRFEFNKAAKISSKRKVAAEQMLSKS
jgi:hypothetical protein